MGLLRGGQCAVSYLSLFRLFVEQISSHFEVPLLDKQEIRGERQNIWSISRINKHSREKGL
jgi:hypothetical protein